ncbi:MAG: cytidylate kinase-like family protein [Acidobacteria bacterium]|nr:cytidylate kinase-like family protein [Acidobacteriota bacterium]
MPIVTIRGHLGSSASEIGRQIAERLQVDYIDRQIIAQVAELLNESKQEVIAKEMPPGSLWGRIARALGFDNTIAGSYPMEPGYMLQYSGAYLPAWQIPLDDTRYLAGLESVIKALARSQSAVICGRGSQFILKDHPGALHVLIVSPLEIRVKRVMQNMGKSREEAEKEVEHSDGSRHEFIKRYFKAEMEDPLHYDIVVNTEHLSIENAASVVIDALPFKDRL